MAPAPPAPRILLVMPDQWPRALLRAALREVGYDAVGTRALSGALDLASAEADRGPVGLIVLDQGAVAGGNRRGLEELRARTGAPVLFLAPATRRIEDGPWTRVVRRPVDIGGLVREVETLVPLAPEARRPVDQSG